MGEQSDPGIGWLGGDLASGVGERGGGAALGYVEEGAEVGKDESGVEAFTNGRGWCIDWPGGGG